MKKKLIPIEQFIKEVKTYFINSQFTSPEAMREFDWSNETAVNKVIRPIIRFYTEGMCYWFAKMLNDAYPGGRMCVKSGCGHIVYYYEGKIYDIEGIHLEKAKYFPVEYFGDKIDDFKHNYVGGCATIKDIREGKKKAKDNNDIIKIGYKS